MKTKLFITFISIFLLLVGAFIASMLIGSVNIPLRELLSEDLRSILMLRFSRALLGCVAGASLAVVGAILQGLLKNPLADPYVLGVSSGSGLGAVLAIMLGISLQTVAGLSLPLFAFAGGLITILFVYFLSRRSSRVNIEDLLLSGVIVTAMLSGIIMFIVSVVETEGLHTALWWLLGNTQIYDMRLLIFVTAVALIGILISIALARNLNIMSLGEEEAIASGMNVEKIKIIFFLISSLITAVIVSCCGMIGFVGLIIPHISRRIVGPDHRRLIPASALIGAIFLMLCDILARRVAQPMELPIGVITAFFGGPFFIVLLNRSRRFKQ